MWSRALNFKASDEYLVGDLLIMIPTVVGMALEGIALMGASQALSTKMNMSSFQSWSIGFQAALVALVCYMVACFVIGAPGSFYLQPCQLLGVAFPMLLPACYKNALMSEGDAGYSASAVRAWRRITAGNVLNLVGLVLMASLDNSCSGVACITEYLPWEASPCRWVASVPKGSSCPLPADFNHAAVMHIVCAIGAAVSVSGLVGLVDSQWEPQRIPSSADE